MNNEDYESEVKRQLGDNNTYRKLKRDPFPEVVRELNRKLDEAVEAGLLLKRESIYLSVDDYNIPTF